MTEAVFVLFYTNIFLLAFPSWLASASVLEKHMMYSIVHQTQWNVLDVFSKPLQSYFFVSDRTILIKFTLLEEKHIYILFQGW